MTVRSINNPNKSLLSAWAVLSFEICFMLCIFAPLDVYFGNIQEYWFSAEQLLPVIAIAFIVLFILVSTVFYFFSRTKAAAMLFSLFTVILLYFYIQGNYVPRNYGVLNGSIIEWEKYTDLGLVSIGLAIVCLILFVLLIMRFRRYAYKVGKYLALFLFLLQIVTIGTLYFQTKQLSDEKKNSTTIVTDNDLMTYSDNGHNILVILLDTFDGEFMSRLITEQPERSYKTFNNFTWYRNTSGVYPTTKGAMPYIFTGVWYQNEVPYSEYVKAAYQTSEIYPVLKENGYELDVYTDNIYLCQDEGFYHNVINDHYSIKNTMGFAGCLFKQVAFNYMPHQLKSPFTIYSGDFNSYRGTSIGDEIFSEDVQLFYQRLVSEEIQTQSRGNLFKFIHLEGVHGFYTFGEDLITHAGEQYSEITEAEGNLTLLQELFSQMKKRGIYEDSTIIVMADHGNSNYSQNPIFLIKNQYETHEFEISDVEMTYEYLPDLYMKLASGNQIEASYISSLKPEYGKRRFLYYSWDNAWEREYMPGMNEMFLTGSAMDPNGLESSGIHFFPQEEAKEYQLGSILSFKEEDDTAQPYCEYGFLWHETDGTRVRGKECVMRMKVKGEYNNLLLSLDAKSLYYTRRVQILANNNEVGVIDIDREDAHKLVIPHDYLSDNELILKLKIVENPDRHSDTLKTGNNDFPILLKSISISSTDQAFNLNDQLATTVQDKNGMFFYPSELATNGTNNGRIVLTKGQVQYGPYISVNAGTWEVRVQGKGLADARYHATANIGETVIPIDIESLNDNYAIYRFTLEEALRNVEFLTECTDQEPVYIDMITLTEDK